MRHFTNEVIIAAIRGDKEAIEEVLRIYDAYITKLATFQTIDSNGRKYVFVSEDAKQEIREKLITELPKIRGLPK